MGINFYCIKKMPRERRDEALQEMKMAFMRSDEFILEAAFKDIIDEYFPKEIHLGKRSGGNQFCWDWHQGVYFEPNLQSIKNFLSDPDLIIYDEYCKVLTVDEFFGDEIGEYLYADKGHIGLDGLKEWKDYYFTSDKLLFARFEDFC